MNSRDSFKNFYYERKDWWVCPSSLILDVSFGCKFNCFYCMNRKLDKSVNRFLKRNLSSPVLLNFNEFEKKVEKIPSILHLCLKTDFFQWSRNSEQGKIVEKILLFLLKTGKTILIETKSIFLLEYIDILIEFLKNNRIFVVYTLFPGNDEFSSRFEENCPSYSKRIKTIETLVSNGFKVGVKSEPLLVGQLNFNTIFLFIQELDKIGVYSWSFYYLNHFSNWKEWISRKINILKVLEAINEENPKNEWITTGEQIFKEKKEKGLKIKITSPDWVNFWRYIELENCCGGDIIPNKYTYLHLVEILKKEKKLDINRVEQEFIENDKKLSFFIENWEGNPDLFTLKDLKGIKFEKKNGVSIYYLEEKNELF